MFCHNCGTENTTEAKFCNNCGTQLIQITSAEKKEDIDELTGKPYTNIGVMTIIVLFFVSLLLFFTTEFTGGFLLIAIVVLGILTFLNV